MGREIRVEAAAVITIGRGREASLRCPDPRVSRRHLELRPGPGGWTLIDLDSTNGTFREGRRIQSLAVTGTLAVLLGDARDGVRLEVEPAERPGADAQPPQTDAQALRARAAGQAAVVRGSELLRIGRDRTNTIVVEDPRVSRFHVEVRLSVGTWWLEDVGSVNGTFVDGDRIEELAIEQPTRVLLGDPETGVTVDLEPPL